MLSVPLCALCVKAFALVLSGTGTLVCALAISQLAPSSPTIELTAPVLFSLCNGYTPFMPKPVALLRVRPAKPRDVPAIASLIRGLAKYERLIRGCRTDLRRLRRHGFGSHRYFQSLLVTRTGRPIGFAVYYFTYSTFTCRPVLFIEDLFVLPEERGAGAGVALMKALARVAVRKGCRQMEWIVLDWNEPAIRFYQRLGARLDRSWALTRLTGPSLRRLATSRS